MLCADADEGCGGFRPGYMMLIREGEGEGARDDTTLDTRELADMSQFWRRSSSSSFVGPLLTFSAIGVCMCVVRV